MRSSIGVFFIFEIIFRIHCSGNPFQVDVTSNGSYSIRVNNITWLNSGDTAFYADGNVFAASNGSLQLTGATTVKGIDSHYGPWTATSFLYQAGSTTVNATIQVYSNPNFSAAIFTQSYLNGAANTSAKYTDAVIGKFPSFKLEGPENYTLGYLAPGGDLVGYSKMSIGRLLHTAKFTTGMTGGPLLIFDNSSNAIIISPLSEFMATSGSLEQGRQLNWGIMGLVNDVYEGYTVNFILYYSNKGINQVVRSWGNYLTTLYGKSRQPRDNDPTIQYLGYWTNNGGYYYYNTEKGKNYEATILDVVDYTTNISVPFKYLQFDSWFYLKGKHDGVKTWEPQSNIFPNGFQYIYNKTKLPFGAHNRFWDIDTTYASYNGGKYTFLPDKTTGFSVPYDYQFWLDLFNSTTSWGKFILYEQDWLNRETDRNSVLHTDVFVGHRWLVNMGNAASKFGITIQYCLSYCSHILQALEIPAVTQARVSRDYLAAAHQWNIGITSLFVDALNIAPFKDTFWTTVHEPGNPYNKTEPTPALQALISTLSTGPVGPGDGIGFINKTLLMRCCDVTGRILKPDQAATAIDDQIKRSAFGGAYPGPTGEVYTSFTVIGGHFFGIIVAASLGNTYSITPSSAWPTVQFLPSLAFSAFEPKKLFNFSDSDPIKLTPACTSVTFCLYYSSPVIALDGGEAFVLLGELDKWVPVSRQRFSNITTDSGDVNAHLVVQAKEAVTVTYYNVSSRQVTSVVCDNTNSSKPAPGTVLSLAKGSCTVA